jgi:hypothetical protein
MHRLRMPRSMSPARRRVAVTSALAALAALLLVALAAAAKSDRSAMDGSDGLVRSGRVPPTSDPYGGVPLAGTIDTGVSSLVSSDGDVEALVVG